MQLTLVIKGLDNPSVFTSTVHFYDHKESIVDLNYWYLLLSHLINAAV